MQRILRLGGRLACSGALLAVALLVVGAGPADATPPSDTSPPAVRSQMERWKGRYCPPAGCAGAPRSPLRAAAGFAAAIVATGWVASRQR